MKQRCVNCGEEVGPIEGIDEVKHLLAGSEKLVPAGGEHTVQDLCHRCRRRARFDSAMGRTSVVEGFDLQTINGFHVSGFSKKRDEAFYGGEEHE